MEKKYIYSEHVLESEATLGRIPDFTTVCGKFSYAIPSRCV